MKNFVGWVFTGRSKKKAFLKEKIETSSSLPPLIERILLRRGIAKDDFESFLNPKVKELLSFEKWESLREGIDLIKWAIKGKKFIHIHSDYDVDGITSLSMLGGAIKFLGGNFSYSISNRFKDGYGIPRDIFENFSLNNEKILISLDCGTNSKEVQDRAKKEGLNFLIIDHHPPLFDIDKFLFFCNTHQEDCPIEFKNFSTAGIIFKFVEGLYKSFGKNFPFNSYIRLSSLGLAQDITEMVGENRSIVYIGLNEIPKTKNIFLRGLLKSSGLEGKKLTSDHLYYRLGPRLNAPGRMEDGTFLIDLLLYPEEEKVKRGIEKIESLNRLRQEVQEKIYKEALGKIKDERVIICYNPNWHLGVLGLVASKLVQEKGRISIVLSKDKDLIKGSGRSIEDVSLIEILEKAKGLLEGYGGHRVACGLSLKESNYLSFLGEMKKIMEGYPVEEKNKIEIEEELDFKDLIDLKDLLEKLEPYGNKNPKPIFVTHNVNFYEEPIILKNGAYLLKFFQGKDVLKGIGFDIDKFNFRKNFSLVYSPEFYDGNISLKFLGIFDK